MRFARTVLAAALTSAVVAMAPAHAADYAKTQYPIVLVHGLAGVSKYFGFIDYWWQIPGNLRSNGATVYVADLSAFGDETLRGEELLRQIRTVLAATGARKVNLIGHSQGGLSSRYAAAVMPQAVASVTTIGTPHRGSEVADWIASTPSIVQDFLAGGASLAGSLLGLLVGKPQPQNPLGALQVLTTSGAADFNRRFPSAGLASSCSASGAGTDYRNGNVQRLYSWTGYSSGTNILDIIDPFMVLGDATIRLRGGGSNDGLVSVCSARFGQTLGTYAWNHVDEINHMFGLRGLFTADPVVTIRTHANRLKLAGL
ncbi:MAG TPA: triacylglycerol lipase [Paucimonas sp.]|nr:triacylglycerol lipase [Paucimonas sp.]